MCVAFGVLSGLPVPTGDRLASLHAGSLLRLDGSTEPGLATRGRLDRRQHPEMLPPCLSPPCPHRTLRHRDRAPAPACPRTSRETLRRRKQSKYRPLSAHVNPEEAKSFILLRCTRGFIPVNGIRRQLPEPRRLRPAASDGNGFGIFDGRRAPHAAPPQAPRSLRR